MSVPTEPGWYWRRAGGWAPVEVVTRLTGELKGQLVTEYGVVREDGLWGPRVESPSEPEPPKHPMESGFYWSLDRVGPEGWRVRRLVAPTCQTPRPTGWSVLHSRRKPDAFKWGSRVPDPPSVLGVKEPPTPAVTNDTLLLYRCVHCERVTILRLGNPQARCKCGAEFYPVSRRIVEGESMTIAQVRGEALEE